MHTGCISRSSTRADWKAASCGSRGSTRSTPPPSTASYALVRVHCQCRDTSTVHTVTDRVIQTSPERPAPAFCRCAGAPALEDAGAVDLGLSGERRQTPARPPDAHRDVRRHVVPVLELLGLPLRRRPRGPQPLANCRFRSQVNHFTYALRLLLCSATRTNARLQ